MVVVVHWIFPAQTISQIKLKVVIAIEVVDQMLPCLRNLLLKLLLRWLVVVPPGVGGHKVAQLGSSIGLAVESLNLLACVILLGFKLIFTFGAIELVGSSDLCLVDGVATSPRYALGGFRCQVAVLLHSLLKAFGKDSPPARRIALLQPVVQIALLGPKFAVEEELEAGNVRVPRSILMFLRGCLVVRVKLLPTVP